MNFLMASILDFPAKLFAGRLFIIIPPVVLLYFEIREKKNLKSATVFPAESV
jgi:hypothetical protein